MKKARRQGLLPGQFRVENGPETGRPAHSLAKLRSRPAFVFVMTDATGDTSVIFDGHAGPACRFIEGQAMSFKRWVLLWALCGALYWARAISEAPQLTIGEQMSALPVMLVTWPVKLYSDLSGHPRKA
jgi:hypothetical protein